MEDWVQAWLVLGGGALGVLFGVVVQRSRFCMVAAVSNWTLMRDYRQVHAYLAAVAIAVAGTQILEIGGWAAIADSGYRSPGVDWLGLLAGGLIFGFGSLLAGGCAGRTAVRAAEGNLGPLITLLVFALAAAGTYYGLLEPVRGWLADRTSTQLGTGDASLAALTGLPSWAAAGAMIITCVALIAFLGRETRSLGMLAAGGAVGMLVTLGWWLTGTLTQDGFSAHLPASLTFSGPLASAAVLVTTGNVAGHTIALPLLAGTLLGAFASALLTRSFRWTMPQADKLGHLLTGGALMGIGAILAGGCNIGQGLSGVSTMSAKAFLAVAAIVVGMRLGLAWLMRREFRAGEPQSAGITA